MLAFVAAGFVTPISSAANDSDDLQFILHNLHFTKFDAFGFQAPAVAHAVHRDSKGRLWIGTESGLFLYDGHEVRLFEPSPDRTSGIPHGFVKAIAETDDGTIWIGTWGGGLAHFDESHREFRTPTFDPPSGIQFDPKIWSLDIDSKGRLWLGTFASGLFRYEPASQKLDLVYQADPNEHPRANRIDAVFVDRSDNVWFAPIARQTHVINADTFEPVATFSLDALLAPKQRDSATDIGEFDDGRIFLLFQNALRIFSPRGELLTDIELTVDKVDSRLMEALPYSDTTVLLGTGERLWHLDLESGQQFAIPAGTWRGGMEPSIIWDMDKTSSGDLLLAGNNGVWINPSVSRQFWTIATDDPPAAFIETRAIVRQNGKLYLNSANAIYEIPFDELPVTAKSIRGRLFSRPPIGYPLWMEAAPGNCFWSSTDIGVTHICGNGQTDFVNNSSSHVLLLDPAKQQVIFSRDGLQVIDSRVDPTRPVPEIRSKANRSSSHPATHLSFGMHDDIWVGTFNGMQRADRRTRETLPAFENGATNEDWTDPFTFFVKSNSKDEILVGTSSGLFRGELGNTGAVASLTKLFNGTPLGNSAFHAMLELPDQHYISITDFGYALHDNEGSDFELISYDRGVPNYHIYGGGFREYDDGISILSGLHGPVIFRPADLEFAQPESAFAFSDLRTFRDNELMAWPIKNGLVFEHRDRVIQFKFGLLDYLSPENNHYQIRLGGFSDEWLDVGRLGEFNFTDLDPDDYVLEVRAMDGLFPAGQKVSLSFSVLPPWWRTWWAYALYALIIFGSLFWYWLSLQRKIQREREISGKLREADRIKSHFLSELEEKVEEATQDLRHAVEALEIKNIELDAAQSRAVDASRLKSEFLADMSHEIRTPMNGILGFTQLLEKTPLDNDQRDYVHTVDKSARSLLGIINDVLDVSKIEAGKLIIDSVGFDLRECLSDTLEALAPVAYEKSLELIWQVDNDVPEGLRGDPIRLRQMITNLVGNGLKFTNSGHVHVRVSRGIDAQGLPRLRVTVSDTGRGITSDDQQKLFNAFERGSISLSANYTGTGLGLVITKKLCEAMGGAIALESTPGEGTRIDLDLPLVADRNPENRYGHGKPLQDRKILLVDAHPQSREALRTRFEHWGADVTALAAFTNAGDADLIVIGLERNELTDTDRLVKLCSHLPAGVPKIGLLSSVDRDVLREIGDACGAPCISKLAGPESQLRRLLQALGEQWRDQSDDAIASETRLAGLHVLVADDNRINRYFLKKMLELHGANVIEADSGSAVLRYLSEADHAPIDLAMLDIHMPDMDGLEVARRIRSAGNQRLPLLAVSANVQPETYEAALAAGINDYLLKPVDESKLVEAVLEWTGREEMV